MNILNRLAALWAGVVLFVVTFPARLVGLLGLVLVLTLAGWKISGQSFGSFSADQPFLAGDATTAIDELDRWPTNLLSYFDTLSDTNVILSGTTVTNWVNKATASDPATNVLTDSPYWVSTGGAAGTNGYVDFTGNTPGTVDWLIFSPTNTATTLADTRLPITVACVYWLDRTNDPGPAIAGGVAGVGTSTSGLLIETFYSPKGLQAIRSSRNSAAVTAALPATGAWHRVVAVLGFGIQMWTNGVYVGTNYLGGTPINIGQYNLGRYNAYGYFFDGRMARFMMWRGELSSNQCVEVDTLMKNDFGL